MRKLLAAAAVTTAVVAMYAAPAATYAEVASATTLTGTCDIPGTATFSVPLKLTPQPLDFTFNSDPGSKCTGFVNGELVQDTPDGHVAFSCGVVGYAIDADTRLSFDALAAHPIDAHLNLASVAAQNVLYITGKKGGQATGRASIFGQNDQVALLQGCIDGDKVTSLKVTVTVVTAPSISG
jgi:hypothetical protein